MNTWNHRIIVRFEEDGTPYFQVHECHYTRRGATTPRAWTQDAIRPIGDDLDELRTTLQRMLAACEKPVLVEKTRPDGTQFLKQYTTAGKSTTQENDQ